MRSDHLSQQDLLTDRTWGERNQEVELTLMCSTWTIIRMMLSLTEREANTEELVWQSSVIVTSGPSQRVSAWAEKEVLGGPHWRIQTLNWQSFHSLSSIFEDLLCARQDSRLWGYSNDKVSLLKGLHFCARVQRLMMGEWIDGWIHRYSHIDRYTWNKFRRW